MLLRIILIVLVLGNVLAYDFDDVYKNVPDEVRVLVGAESGSSCEGVVWRRRYVLTRDSCLGDSSTLDLTVVKTGSLGWNNTKTYRVLERFTHPDHVDLIKDNDYDVTLLILNEPFFDVTESVPFDFVSYSYQPWINAVAYYYENQRQAQEQYMYLHKSNVFSSNLQMFLVTIVLPFGIFVLFFILVTIYVDSKGASFGYNQLNGKKIEDTLL